MQTIEQKFLALGIQPKGNGVEQKVRCPKCASLGKKNWKDTCLSINLVKEVCNYETNQKSLQVSQQK